MRRRRTGAMLLVGVGLLAGWGIVRGQVGGPPRTLDLEAQAVPLPPSRLEVIATTQPPAPRPVAPPVHRVVYQLPDSPPPSGSGSANAIIPGAGAESSEATPPAAPPAVPAPPAAAVPTVEGALTAVKPGAALAVEVVGPAQAAPGQTVALEIVVRNVGNRPLTRVRIETPLPSGGRLLLSDPPAEVQGERLAWTLGGLDTGAERRLRLDVKAVAEELSLWPTATFAAAEGLRVPIVRPPFAVSITGPEVVAPGARVGLQVQATNNTDAPLELVILKVQLPPGLDHPEAAKAQGQIVSDPFQLAAGATRSFPLDTQAVRSGRQVVEVSASCRDGKPAAPARAIVVVTEPPLALRHDGPRQAALKRDFDLRIEVANPNNTAATNVRLFQAVPQGLEVVAATTGAVPAPNGQGILWSLGALSPGQKRTLACTLRPRAAGDWPLFAAVIADGAGEVRATHAVHVEGATPLSLEVMAREDVVPVGGEAVYEVRVVNLTDMPATNLRLTAWVPAELTAVEGRGPTEVRLQAAQMLFAPLPQLGPHTDAVYHLHVRGRQPGQGRLRVEMNADQLGQPAVQEVGARVPGGSE